MANFNETIQWVKDVYRLATTDPVLGGDSTAPSNKGLAAVTDRTAYLKSELEKLQNIVKNIHPIGQLQALAAAAFNAADYEQSGTTEGLGRAGTPAENWAICNGKNGTLDMGGNFAVGWAKGSLDYGSVGQTGGKDKVTLSTAELPPLNLNGGNPQARYAVVDGKSTQNTDLDDSANEPNLLRAAQIPNIGGGQAHENRPPFVTIIWRQRINN